MSRAALCQPYPVQGPVSSKIYGVMAICHGLGSEALWVDEEIDIGLQAELRDPLKGDRVRGTECGLQGQDGTFCCKMLQNSARTVETEPPGIRGAI